MKEAKNDLLPCNKQGEKVSILPTIYMQLLRVQIPKAQKLLNLTVFLRFWDLCVKVAHKMLVKLTPDALSFAQFNKNI